MNLFVVEDAIISSWEMDSSSESSIETSYCLIIRLSWSILFLILYLGFNISAPKKEPRYNTGGNRLCGEYCR